MLYKIITPFHATGLFLYPLFSGEGGAQKEASGMEWLKLIIRSNSSNDINKSMKKIETAMEKLTEVRSIWISNLSLNKLPNSFKNFAFSR